jgi:hypothetical protein
LADAARDAEKALQRLEGRAGIGAVVRDAQLTTALTAIRTALRDLWRDVGNETQAGMEEARIAALTSSLEWDTPLFKLVTSARERDAMKRGLLASAVLNVEAAMARIYKTRIPLSEQVYKTADLVNGWLDRLVNSALARGANYSELAREVREYIRPDVRGGVSYAAMRLARTEINNAYHAVSIDHERDKPWTLGMRWRLSRSHPHVDICDDLARRDSAGLGAGVFPSGDVPRKPHPQCLCYVTPELPTNDQFFTEFHAGKYDDFLKRTYGV